MTVAPSRILRGAAARARSIFSCGACASAITETAAIPKRIETAFMPGPPVRFVDLYPRNPTTAHLIVSRSMSVERASLGRPDGRGQKICERPERDHDGVRQPQRLWILHVQVRIGLVRRLPMPQAQNDKPQIVHGFSQPPTPQHQND